jgi:hypothetical protein
MPHGYFMNDQCSITKGTNTRDLRDNVDVDTNRGETIAIMKDKIIKLDLSSYKNILISGVSSLCNGTPEDNGLSGAIFILC